MTLPPAIRINMMIGLSLIGLGISGYLTYAYLSNEKIPCTTNWLSGCDAVQQSPYAQLAGVPIPVYGTFFYLGTLVWVTLMKKFHQKRTWGRLFWLALILAVGFSVYLTFLEAFVIKAWCIWCVGSALTTLGLVIVWLTPNRGAATRASGPPQPPR